MNYLSVCSGIEAATVAWEPLGFRPLGFSEIEPFPSKLLAHHYADVPNFGDMTRFEEWKIHEPVDLLVGGTPCQSFSVAGLRKGLDDPRGNLMLTYLALARRYRPRWMVWENVPGVLSSNGGRDFGTFLGALGELGYGWAYRVLDAQYFGVAQRRRRVFVVGHLGDWHRAAAVLFERQSLSGHPAPRREAREAAAGDAKTGIGECDKPITARMVSFGEYSDYGSASALKARDYKDATDLVAQPVGTDCFNGQITGNIAATMGTRGSSQNSNGPTVLQPVDIYVSSETAKALRAQAQSAHDNSKETYVAFNWNAQASQLPSQGADTSINHGLTCSQQPAVAFALQHAQIGRKDSAGPQGKGWQEEIAFTQDSISVADAVAVAIRTANTGANGHGIAEGVAHTLDLAQGQAVATAMQVRRLTPVECERLQGFPDEYTNIPGAKDGPRYKALGNSMAVPVMRWIGRRLAMVDAL